jgi:hypothetical protein
MGYLHLLFTYDKVKNSMEEKSHTVPMIAESLSLMLTIKDNPLKET